MEIKLIHLENMKFCFLLSKRDCYERLTGRCSLDEEVEVQNNDDKAYCGKWSYCRELYHALIEGKVNNKENPLSITKVHCGHYVVSDGQHRLCVAKKMKLGIYANVNVSESKVECNFCREKEDAEKLYILV